jgi:hypothetical protein
VPQSTVSKLLCSLDATSNAKTKLKNGWDADELPGGVEACAHRTSSRREPAANVIANKRIK